MVYILTVISYSDGSSQAIIRNEDCLNTGGDLRAGGGLYLSANLYNPAAYEWAGLNGYYL